MRVSVGSAFIVLALLSDPAGAQPATSTPPADPTLAAPDGSALERITSSFDVKYAAAVLRQVAKIFHAGYLRRDAEAVAREIDLMPADQTRSWAFQGVYKGHSYPLQIRARLDDFGTLDLDFFAPALLAGRVRTAVDGYLNARRL